ncbi:BrnT family toxin [Roseococcus thiosulfatophilus]|uniref:BrnT family toxin n=1 Tax=Roseococcus thiosulfatophilus TaxID=35813 RepID=UPI001F5E3010|nr:BrnT family toxin [Roseococcus thiosulfatophilus]
MTSENANQMFEWDEAKRHANLAKHGLDFLDADLVLEGPHLLTEARTVDGEVRHLAIGRIAGRHVAMIFTERDGAIRVISLRKARQREREQHQAAFGD